MNAKKRLTQAFVGLALLGLGACEEATMGVIAASTTKALGGSDAAAIAIGAAAAGGTNLVKGYLQEGENCTPRTSGRQVTKRHITRDGNGDRIFIGSSETEETVTKFENCAANEDMRTAQDENGKKVVGWQGARSPAPSTN